MAELVTKSDLQLALAPLEAKIDNLALRLTVRSGIIAAASIATLATIIKLF